MRSPAPFATYSPRRARRTDLGSVTVSTAIASISVGARRMHDGCVMPRTLRAQCDGAPYPNADLLFGVSDSLSFGFDGGGHGQWWQPL
jgi:hypothetical protein